jgi:thermostable 8-oxoguanine DNA glycosylase
MKPLPICWDNSSSLTIETLKDNEVRRFVAKYLNSVLSPQRELWFREVALCLLTPQTSPLRAEAAMDELWAPIEFGKLTVAFAAKILGRSEEYVRFHNVKAKRLVALVEKRGEIEALLERKLVPIVERDALYELVNGFGLKEAGHALRNIGRRGAGAIFDRHIFRNLVSLEVIDKVPSSLSERGYRELEKSYLEYLHRQKLDIDEVDLIMWGHQTGFLYK